MKRLLMLMFFCIIVCDTNAQEAIRDTTLIKQRIIEKLLDFQYHLQMLGKRELSKSVRDNILKETRTLFIGNGRYYQCCKNGICVNESVDIETYSARTGQRKKQLVADYLISVCNLIGQGNVSIDNANSVYVDNFRKETDGKWIATAHLFQIVTASRDGTNTKKMVECTFIIFINTDDIKDECHVKLYLEDMYVTLK